MTTTTLSTPIATRAAPSSLDWEHHKPVIRQLYIDDDMPLPQLIKHMDDVHNFGATKNMYKKRLLAWDLRKNYRRQEKEAVLSQIEENGEDSVRDLHLHGRPILLSRVKRFEREERNIRNAMPVRLVAENIWTTIEPEEEQHQPQRQQNAPQQQHRSTKKRRRRRSDSPPWPLATTSVSTSNSSIPSHPHLPSSSSSSSSSYSSTPPHPILRPDPHTEHIMHLICVLYDDALLREFAWHQSSRPTSLLVTQRNTSRDTHSSWPPFAWSDIALALHYLSSSHPPNPRAGFWYLDRACQEISSSLSAPKEERLVEFHSMADIVDLFCDPTWDGFPELRRLVLQYLRGLAGMKEGKGHPLTVLWREFGDRERLVRCRDVLQRRLMGGFERRVGRWRIRLMSQVGAREPPQLLYGHSRWIWEGEVVE